LVRRELGAPLFDELRLVQHLRALAADTCVCARCGAFDVDDAGRWLVQHAVAMLARCEAEIGVLPVDWGEALVEPTERAKDIRSYEQARCRRVVDLAYVVVGGQVGIVASP